MNRSDPSSISSEPLITIGPRIRKSPYFEATLRWGARAFTIYNHLYMPTHYGDPVAEYWSLVTDVTLWDVACQRQIRISGPDALPLMELLTPRDLSACPSHQCLYVLLTDENGGMVNDAVLMHLSEDEFWLSPGDGDVLLWAQGVATRLGMDVEIADAEVYPLQLQGPKSPHVASRLFGDIALELDYYRVVETELEGVPLVLSRTGWSGELGYEIYRTMPLRRRRPVPSAASRGSCCPTGPTYAARTTPGPSGSAGWSTWTRRPNSLAARRCAAFMRGAITGAWSASRSRARPSPGTTPSGRSAKLARGSAT
jgi:hypothetical protein